MGLFLLALATGGATVYRCLVMLATLAFWFIRIDNVLIVCGALGGLPDDVRVVEIEPEDLGWGEGFSDTVQHRLPELTERIWSSTKP